MAGDAGVHVSGMDFHPALGMLLCSCLNPSTRAVQMAGEGCGGRRWPLHRRAGLHSACLRGLRLMLDQLPPPPPFNMPAAFTSSGQTAGIAPKGCLLRSDATALASVRVSWHPRLGCVGGDWVSLADSRALCAGVLMLCCRCCRRLQALPDTSGFLTGETVVVNGATSAVINFWDVAGASACLQFETRPEVSPNPYAAKPCMGAHSPPAHVPTILSVCSAAAHAGFQYLQPTQTFRGHAEIVTALRGIAGDGNTFVSGACAATWSLASDGSMPLSFYSACLLTFCVLPFPCNTHAGDKEGCMHLWDRRSPSLVGSFGTAGADGRQKCAKLPELPVPPACLVTCWSDAVFLTRRGASHCVPSVDVHSRPPCCSLLLQGARWHDHNR